MRGFWGEMIQRNKIIKIYLLLAIFFLIVLGITLLRISYLPFGSIKAKIDTFSSSGNASLFTEAIFKQIVIKLRFVGFTFLIMSGLLYITRQHIQKYILNILTSCILFLREIKQQFIDALKNEDKIHLYTLFVIFILAIAVRIFFIFQPMRYDEAATFNHYASKPLYYGLSSYTFPNNHIFHTFWAHMAYLFLGDKPWVIRLPAFIAGILIVPASYFAIRLFYNKYAALLTAGLVASSSHLIEYSTNARGYTLICLFFLLILILAKILKENRNPFGWLLFSVLSALGFYTIPIMLYPFGIVMIWLFLSIIFDNKINIHRNILLKDLSVSLIITITFTFILYLPVLLVTGLKSIIENDFVLSKLWSDFIKQIPVSIHSVWSQWNRDISIILSLLMAAGFIASVIFHKKIAADRVPLILSVIFWIINILMLQRVVPYNRVWLFLLPLYIGLASSGIAYIVEAIHLKINRDNKNLNFIFALLTILLFLLLSINVMRTKSIYNSEETGIFRDAEQVAIFLKAYLKEGDRVLSTSEAPLEYYFNLHGLPVDEYLYFSELNSARRILVIINKSNHKSLSQFMNEVGLSAPDLYVPRIIKQFPSATAYEIRKNG